MLTGSFQKQLSLLFFTAGASIASAQQEQPKQVPQGPQTPTPAGQKFDNDKAPEGASGSPAVSVLERGLPNASLNQLSLPRAQEVDSGREVWNFVEREPHVGAVTKLYAGAGQGTGVLIGINRNKPLAGGFEGYILTAAHVVLKLSESNEVRSPEEVIKVEYICGKKSKACSVLHYDAKNDLAIVRAWVPDSATPAPIASEEVKPGDELTFVGLGEGADIACCARVFRAKAGKGTYTSAGATSELTSQIYADEFLIAGDSGGPVFNSKGEVCGVISGGWFWRSHPHDENKQVTWPARAGGGRALKLLLEKLNK
jgi:S1-C subfamily serine protease